MQTENSSTKQSNGQWKAGSVWSLYQWLTSNGENRNPQNNVPHVNSISSGGGNGPGAGTKSGIAAIAAVELHGRQQGQKLATRRPMIEHDSYMATAVQLADSRPAHPFAALLVDKTTGEIVAQGLNSTKVNPLFHGEIVCINNAANSFTRFDWRNTILYTTAEPCCMCQAAILWCRIPEVVFGTSIATLTTLGWDQFKLDAGDVESAAPFAECSILGGVLEPQCDALFQQAAAIRRRRT